MQEIQILAEKYKFIECQLCTARQIDVLTFTLSKFLIDIVFIQVRLARSVKKTLSNVVLTIILRRCSNVLISMSLCQQRKDVLLKVAKTTSIYQPF